MGTVLILEDDSLNLRAISAVLRFNNYPVMRASNRAEALALCKNATAVSLLIADVSLADGSGIEMAVELVEQHPHLPVLFISGTPLAGSTKRDISNLKRFPPNSVDFLQKPFLASQLAIKVRRLIATNSDRGDQAA